MSFPLVSVLVPIWNVELYIERCVKSLLNQTYNNLEFIFIDDASTDESYSHLIKVISEFPSRRHQIQIIRNYLRKGLAAVRNQAIVASNGTFVFHVDSDDWIELNAIELLVKKQLETNADIVTGQAMIYKNGQKKEYLSGGWDLDKETLLIQLLQYKISTTLWRRLIRKSLYTSNNIKSNERGSGGEDFQVLPQLVYFSQKVAGINNFIYNYNKDNNNSLMNNIRNDIDLQIQGYVSVCVISSFFSDKEKHLCDITRGIEVRYLHHRMLQNVVWRNKQGYNTFRNILLKTAPDKWAFIGWNNRIKKKIEQNYYSAISIQKITFIISKLKHNFKHVI